MRSFRRCALVLAFSIAGIVAARTTRGLDLSGETDYGAAVSALSPEDAPLVRLSFIDLHGLSPQVSDGASAEAADLLDRLGARFQIRSKRPGDAHDPRDLLVVVMPGDPGPLLERTVLGAIQRDAPTRALWVFPRTIAAALGLAPDRAAWTAADRGRLATALGRVVAHEVVHLTCPWRDHDRTGLMAARMSPATLRGEALDLEDELRRDFVLGAAAHAHRFPPIARASRADDGRQVAGVPQVVRSPATQGRLSGRPWTGRGQAARFVPSLPKIERDRRLARRLRKG